MKLGQPDLFTKRIRKPPPALEFKTQCKLAKTIDYSLSPGWRATAFPAGEERPSYVNAKGKRVSPAGARAKASGVKPGWPDYQFVSPAGRFYGLELKRGNAPLSDDQVAFQMWADQHLIPYEVARSYDEALQILVGWGAIRVAL